MPLRPLPVLFAALLLASSPAAHAGASLSKMKETPPAADFVLKDLNGKSVRLSRFAGNVVLLNFWATWCQTCVGERPALERLWETYRQRGLVVLAVSIDRSSAAAVRSFVESHRLSVPVLHDRDDRVSPGYGVLGVPTSFLISRNGAVTYRVAGPHDWNGKETRQVIEQLLGGEE